MSKRDRDALIAALTEALQDDVDVDVQADAPPIETVVAAAGDEDRLPWPDDWLDRRDPADARACQSLWAEVLTRALREIVSQQIPQYSGGGPSTPEGWLDGRDFRMVCAFAGLDESAVRSAVRRALRDPEEKSAMLARFKSPVSFGVGRGV